MATGVYCIQNIRDGKMYVGSAAVSLAKRLTSHRYYLNKGTHKNEHLQRAWNKYGSESFEFDVLELCEPDACVLREQHWIDHYNVIDRKYGYNKAPKAGSPLGYRHTPEVRAKVSAMSKGKKKSLEHARHISEGKQNITDETKAKMSASAALRKSGHYDVLKKLTDEQVREIRSGVKLIPRGRKYKWFGEIAKRYGVSLACITGIVYGYRGKTYG